MSEDAGAAWILVARADVLVIASRLGLETLFTAPSVDGLIARLDAVLEP